MIITDLRVNHLENPMGYCFDHLSLSWVVRETSAKRQTFAQVVVARDKCFQDVIHDSGKSSEILSIAYSPEIHLEPYTRYYWKVRVWGDNGETAESDTAWFETAKGREPWKGKWITTGFSKDIHPYFRKQFSVPKQVLRARLYICGLGLYQAYINGNPVTDELLTPFCDNYDRLIQYQTYDVTSLLKPGENILGAMLGNGWYKGRFGFEGGAQNIFGDRFSLLAELRLELADEETRTIVTDDSWQCAPSPVLMSGIYDGCHYDARKEIKDWCLADSQETGWSGAVPIALRYDTLTERLSPPLRVQETLKNPKIIHTPKKETVLDFGQNTAGIISFLCQEEPGKEIFLQFGEILQDGCFYNENLRTAKEEFRYLSNGEKRRVFPLFTFYGFRYVKVTGIKDIQKADFQALVVYSQMKRTGWLETSNEKVNRLFENALWGQKSNFIDVPTDCPQRDERMGWTGDAQVFCATASYNMETAAFYEKYMRDMAEEQEVYHGSVPFVVPDMIPQKENIAVGSNHGSCAWGDAAAIIPWTLYCIYGDKNLLKKQFGSMRRWCEYIMEQDRRAGDQGLWTTGFHFADWLSLDNPDKQSNFGATDCYYVASAYYYHSLTLTGKAAGVLGKESLKKRYFSQAEKVKKAFRDRYFNCDGSLKLTTQTAMVLALRWDLVPPNGKQDLVLRLKEKLEENHIHLETGFVGTPYLCPTLSENGLHSLAVSLLLQEDYPSWLYEVNMGATTIWERWNSVLPNGKLSGTDMNSLNHYAYGAIVEWMYRYLCGIDFDEEYPGFQKARIAPRPDPRFHYAQAIVDTPMGRYRCRWEYKQKEIELQITVPFHAQAEVTLPLKARGVITIDGKEKNADSKFSLSAGDYRIVISEK